MSLDKKITFPKNLKEFGYGFDEGGKLRKVDLVTNVMSKEEGFEFNVSEDPQYNQKRYEALGEVINEYVYDLLEKEGLRRIPVPKTSNAPLALRSSIFASEDAFENEKLLILIHGSGVVRAGQWARRLIINDDLNSGTQLPYIRRGRKLGYGILVLNTNDNSRTIGNEVKKIPGSEDPYAHLRTVWSDYVKGSNAKKIGIIAHSYGGVCTIKFAMENPEEFVKKVFAVAFTDSVHSSMMPTKGTDHIIKITKNWVTSDKPLDTPEKTSSDDVECVSAGTSVHEMTSWSSIESVFRFLEQRYRSVTAKEEL
ncbi:FAM172 family protein homolog CG10038 [Venturia canescens]|uniref:FAM172 family protein homolog CG10038 n=1 Tax=Venturia canescens TaxID=32260 RepID=UPI001C9C4CD8|nr:FAM172 family protein homolog CG10038 [Venturia canescens]